MSGRLRATPLHQVDPVAEGRWRATGEDPQFLLQLDQPLVARGIFCLTARVRGDHSIAPVLYLDLGEGWCEATRHAMEAAGDGRWSLLVALPAGFRQARFDPSEAAVEFELGDVTVEQIPASRLVLELLADEVGSQPERGAELLREVAARWHPDDAHEAGLWLLARGTDVLHRAPDAYRDWITAYDTLQPAMSRTLRAAVAAMPKRPRVLLASPLAGTGRLLDALLAGVRAQLYPDWDLALLADPDTSPALLAQARATTEGDSRVRVEAADLSALLAGSEAAYVLVLAPGQVLRPHALLALVDAMLARPSAGVGYWDSDRLDAADRRTEPNFRPDWNPDLFLAQGYFDGTAMLSMACARAAMEDGVAFADAGTEASRWLLRALGSGGDVPVHVPMVLSHTPIESPPAVAPGARAALVEEALARTDVQARIEARPDGLRIHWPLPEPAPMVSLVIPTRDRVDLLRQCVDSILASTDYPDYEILVVDNQSREAATLAYLRELESEPRVRVLVDDGPFNYSRINNAAIAQARGSLVALVNNDIEVIDCGWLREMVSHCCGRASHRRRDAVLPGRHHPACGRARGPWRRRGPRVRAPFARHPRQPWPRRAGAGPVGGDRRLPAHLARPLRRARRAGRAPCGGVQRRRLLPAGTRQRLPRRVDALRRAVPSRVGDPRARGHGGEARAFRGRSAAHARHLGRPARGRPGLQPQSLAGTRRGHGARRTTAPCACGVGGRPAGTDDTITGIPKGHAEQQCASVTTRRRARA